VSKYKDGEKYIKKSIIHNILQAARLKYLGYYLDDEDRHILIGHNDIPPQVEYYHNRALQGGASLLRHAASEINPEVEDE
jgi:hypothetical protein